MLNTHPATLPYLKALPKGEPVKVFVVGDGDERRVLLGKPRASVCGARPARSMQTTGLSSPR